MTGTPFLYSSIAVGCGALIAVQAATNASLIKSVESLPYSAAILFGIGFLVLMAVALVSGTPPGKSTWSAAPWWSYTGGVVVALYLLSITYLVPRMGVGPAIVLIVTGQILCAALIDAFGLFGVEVRLPSARNLVGAVLVIIGVGLTRST